MLKIFTPTTNRWLLKLCLVGTFACQQNIQQEAITPATPNLISLQEAVSAAQHSPTSTFVQQLLKHKAKQHNTSDIVVVPNQAHPAFYIVNYQEGGYVILAADRRVEPVLAYAETGHFQKTNKLPQGLAVWLSENYRNMQHLQQLANLPVPQVVAKQWQELLAPASQEEVATAKAGSPVSRPAPTDPGCQDYSYTTTAGPLLATAWGQGCSYNDFCDIGTYNCGHVPTGCVATAMAQIMYHFKKPTYFAWANMPTTSGSSAVANLMHEAGLSVGMQYSDTGSSAPTANIGSALTSTYGYQSVEYEDYDYGKMRSNIDAGRPIVLQAFTDHTTTGMWWWEETHPAGEGHAWVCDGYQSTTWQDCSCGCGGSMAMLHMNWGWNELFASNNYNGWYRENDWTVVRTDATFHWQYFKKMIFNIRP